MNPEHSFSERGGWWVVGQTVIMLLVFILGPLCRGAWDGDWIRFAGWVSCGIGAAAGVAGAVTLGPNRTMFPKPMEQAVLIRNGIYACVRHPLYTSVLLLASGWALAWRSGSALLIAGLLAIFFDAKARREERWLRLKFPDYADYQKRVRRFIPWIY